MANKVVYILELQDRYSRHAFKIAEANRRMQAQIMKTTNRVRVFSGALRVSAADLRLYGRRMRNAGMELTAAFTVGFGLVTKNAIQTFSQFEQMEIAIKTLSGSAAKGSRLMTDLKAFAATTPFEMKGLAESAKILIGMGQLDPNDVVSTMQQLGDLAAGTGAKIRGLAFEYSQIRSKGKADAIDLKQLALRGFNVLQVVKEMAAEKGKIFTMEEMQKFASQGAITFEVVRAALARVTGEGGLFFGMMNAQSKTLGGLWSNLKDEMDFANESIGKTLVELFDLKQVTKDLSDMVKRFAVSFREFATQHPQVTKIVVSMLFLLAVIGPLLIVIGLLSSAFGLMATGLGIAVKVTGLALAVKGLSFAFMFLGAVLGFIGIPVWLFVAAVLAVIAAVWLLWDNWDVVTKAIQTSIEFIIEMWDIFVGKLQEGGDFVMKILGIGVEGSPGTGGRSGAVNRAENTARNTMGSANDTLDVTITAPEGVVQKVTHGRTGSSQTRKPMNVGLNNLMAL